MAVYLKVKDIAEHFNVSHDTVRRWIKDKRIPSIDIGTANRPTYRIPASVIGQSVEEAVKKRIPPPKIPHNKWF